MELEGVEERAEQTIGLQNLEGESMEGRGVLVYTWHALCTTQILHKRDGPHPSAPQSANNAVPVIE